MAKKNQQKVAFESGRKVGHQEVMRAVRNVLMFETRNFRDCCVGCYEQDFVSAVALRLRNLS